MAKKLPSQYIELEYIESSGSQYIDTEYVANSTTEIHMVFVLNNKQRYGLYGGQLQGVDTALRAFANGNLLYFAHGGNRTEQSNNLLINTKYSLIHNKTKITINDIDYITSQSTNYQNTTFTAMQGMMIRSRVCRRLSRSTDRVSAASRRACSRQSFWPGKSPCRKHLLLQRTRY